MANHHILDIILSRSVIDLIFYRVVKEIESESLFFPLGTFIDRKKGPNNKKHLCVK